MLDITVTDTQDRTPDPSRQVDLSFYMNESQRTVVSITKKELAALVLQAIRYLFGDQYDRH